MSLRLSFRTNYVLLIAGFILPLPRTFIHGSSMGGIQCHDLCSCLGVYRLLIVLRADGHDICSVQMVRGDLVGSSIREKI